jgi:GAF domain-containing protein
VAVFVVAAVLPIRSHVPLIVLVGAASLYGVYYVARRWGPLYAVPIAISIGLAFDSFYIPPTREFDNWQNWLVVGIYLVFGVLIGAVTARSQRESVASRRARDLIAEEQAALRRVATLVAEGVPPSRLFEAATAEAARLLDADLAGMVRYEPENRVSPVAVWAAEGEHPQLPASWPLEEGDPASLVASSLRPERVDDWTRMPGQISEAVRQLGVRSSVGSPVLVDGRLWGALAIHSTRVQPLPPDTEARLGGFCKLLATALSNAKARGELQRLLDEQAALQRVATLVAEEAPPDRVFATIARELAQLLQVEDCRMIRYQANHTALVVGGWGVLQGAVPVGTGRSLEGNSASSIVFRSGRPARLDDYSEATGPIGELVHSHGVRSAVGYPIVVEGRLWGAMMAATRGTASLPPDTETRMAGFTELAATSIANAEARAEARRLADEQAALRRVATLVAQEPAPQEVFDKIVVELGALLQVEDARMIRYESDELATVVATWGEFAGDIPVGTELPVVGTTVTGSLHRSGRPVRIDYAVAEGELAVRLREVGFRYAVGTPITVEGRLWGGLVVATHTSVPLPEDIEARMVGFTELAATAVSNAEAREEVRRLADEQAALRRVATLVARGAPRADVFAKVAEEVAALLCADITTLLRYEGDGTATVVADFGSRPGIGIRAGVTLPLGGENLAAIVFRTGEPARIDDFSKAGGAIGEAARLQGVQAGVGCPVAVQGRLWGAVVASLRRPGPMPADSEVRISKFTELVGTAIDNAEARGEVEQLAAEQAALRRVATLVAEGAPPTVVFEKVAAEVAELMRADQIALTRYEPGPAITIMAHQGEGAERYPPGTRVPLDGESVTALVLRTAQPVRMDSLSETSGTIGEIVRELGVLSTVGTPIMVDGRIWGAISASWGAAGAPPPPGTEHRLTKFARLLDSAIANADSRAQLTASRARVLAAGDEARRRVVRDLHDGAQQRLIHTIVTLKLAQQALDASDEARGKALVAEALDHAERSNSELRELAQGILPSVLTRGGLRAGIDALVSRIGLPVRVSVPEDRLSPAVEASAYFVVAEALTNVVKHSRATEAEVTGRIDNGTLTIEISDDGVGGADAAGNGLVGISDRVAALGGRLSIGSPPDGGTLVAVELPVAT